MNKKIDSKEENLSNRGFYILLSSCVVVLVLSVFLIVNNISTNQELMKNSGDDGSQDKNIPVAIVTTAKPSQSPKAAASAKPANADDAETFNILPPKKITFAMPVKGEILKKFSIDTLVYSQSMGDWRTHNGIDIKAAVDAPVNAIGDGVIEDVFTDPFMGITIVVSHKDNMKSIYKNLSLDSMVKKGDKVTSKTVISGVGSSAACENLEPPHLHLEITKNGDYVNPEEFLK